MEMRPTRTLYTRASLFLPCATPEEDLAFSGIVKYLRGEQGSRDAPVQGFTISDSEQPVFFGSWYHQGEWFVDGIVLLIIDYKFTPGSPEMKDALLRLKKTLVETYKKNNCEQKAFWIITDRVSLYTEIEIEDNP